MKICQVQSCLASSRQCDAGRACQANVGLTGHGSSHFVVGLFGVHFFYTKPPWAETGVSTRNGGREQTACTPFRLGVVTSAARAAVRESGPEASWAAVALVPLLWARHHPNPAPRDCAASTSRHLGHLGSSGRRMEGEPLSVTILASPETSIRCHCSARSSRRTIRGSSVGRNFGRLRRFRSMTSRGE